MIAATAPVPPPASVYHRKNPFLARLTHHQSLTKPGSHKETRHFVLSLKGSGLAYAPGDSLGVYARNSPRVVAELLGLLGFDADATVPDHKGQLVNLRHALLHKYILNRASRKIMTGLAERIPQGEQRNRLMEIVDNDEELSAYLHTRDYVDVLKEFEEARFETPASFLAQLTPIPPRLYSIASSLQAHPDEVHLCIAVVRYATHDREKTGLASGYFADHIPHFDQEVPVYVQESRHFRLPANRATDIIMIGPGTGIAPFRAFLEQRLLEGATGRHWLFFGEQHRATDFLYEEELLAWHQQGRLHRLDLAFSRDQSEKIYVQHRMLEQGRELWDWLRNGAVLYVCGDAKRMAKGVHETLIEIARKHGNLSPEAAAAYINETMMRQEKRYLRDVY